jgi:hypothetical protein
MCSWVKDRRPATSERVVYDDHHINLLMLF